MNNATTKRLTKAQAARVREMMVDEGCTRAEAMAWVHEMESSPTERAPSCSAQVSE